MTIEHLKCAAERPETRDAHTRAVVEGILSSIESGGEDVCRAHVERLEGWRGEIVLRP